MRRCILFVLFLCLYRLAWGQADYEYRYWFDMDEGTQHSGTFQPGSHSLDVDLSELDASLHFLHFQVKDGDGVWSVPITRRFVKVLPAASSLVYWMDDESQRATLPSLSGHFDIDVSGLSDGLHYLRLQFREASGQGSTPWSGCFLKLPQPDQCTFHYWFDNEQDHARQMEYLGAPALLDVSDLSDGLHRMYIQMEGNASASIPTAHLFVKVPQTEGVSFLTCLCTVDGQLYKVEQVPSEGGIVNWNLEVAALSQGLHNIQVQTLTPSGAATNCSNHFFFRTATREELDGMKLVYSLDGNEFHTMAGDANNGVFHFDVDVAAMEDGLHRLAYHLASDNGTSTKISTAFFIKTPVGGPGIISYSYWLNDREEEACTTTLDKRANPFSLVSLLPVESEPIRSSCFHFELREGQPMMYAKNDFHIAFYDVSGRRVDESRQFVDYNVSQPITNLTPLETTQTFARPGENEVKWFTFEAEYGDSIALKSNRPVGIQVFDATGKEVYATSADKSVKYGGCHLLADGTCYVAVHDVTGTGSNVTLDAQFIDKFAIFDYTPDRFASMGKTLMTFKGNGLEYVRSVELTDGETTFVADTIIATSDNMVARFSLNENVAATQLYTLNLHFHNAVTDESKTISYKDGVALEPANNVPQLAVEIVTETRVGDPYPIKVTLTNEGNVPQYCIPVNIAFDNVDKLDEFLFSDFELLVSDSLYDSRGFFTYTSDLVGTGQRGCFIPLLVTYMGPRETRTYSFGVRTKIPHAKFNFYAWAGRPWTVSPIEDGGICPDSSNISDLYDLLDAAGYLDPLMDLPISPASVLRPFIGFAESIAGIIQGSTRTCEDAVFEARGIAPSERDQYRFRYRYSVRSPRDIARDALNLPLPELEDQAKSPCPKPTPHPVDVYIPGDPNEMTGYEAPSGSRYMKDDVVTVGYDIEFENDPEIANSAAHCIVIENQLDPTKFNLKTFTPKDITLSGKKVELDGSKSFVQTLDLRPEIDAIAELQCAYNAQTGLIRWTFTSLDPMTMEPTDDIMQGVLPVNYDGTSGIGNVTYTVDLLKAFPDGTEIANKASIIFDNNDPIETPLWVNTIDAVTPAGQVDEVVLRNDTTATIHCVGSDERSGVWKYEVYVQYGSGELWEKVGECPADSAYIDFRVYDSMDYGFCAQAVDSAGNVEAKELVREVSLITYVAGDANGDGVVDIEDVVAAVSYFLDPSSPILFGAANVTKDDRIDIEDVVGISSLYLASTRYARKAVPARMRLREVLSSTQNE